MIDTPPANRSPLPLRLLGSLCRIVAAVAVCYVIALLALAHYYPRIVYQPTRGITLTPASVGIPEYEDLSLSSEAGGGINAWFVPTARKNGATLLLFHGNAGNLTGALQRIMLYRKLGFDTLAIDYHGFGLSDGEPSEATLYKDAVAAWDYLTRVRGIPPGSIIILGFSLGGGVASWLGEKHPEAAGLILESTFTSLTDLVAALYPMFPARLILGGQYETLKRLPDIRLPLLVIHSRQDEMIGFSHGESLFSAYHGAKSFLEIGGDHNAGFMWSAEKYGDGIRKFAEGLGYSVSSERGGQSSGARLTL